MCWRLKAGTEASVQRNGTSKEDEEKDKGVGGYEISLGMAEHQGA